jgi:hypothetical protein
MGNDHSPPASIVKEPDVVNAFRVLCVTVQDITDRKNNYSYNENNYERTIMNDRIKKFKDEHRADILLAGAATTCAIIGIIGYTKTCKRMGYAMVRPIGYDAEGCLHVRTVTGLTLVPNVKRFPVSQT